MFALISSSVELLRKQVKTLIFSPNYSKVLLGLFVVWFGVWAIDPPHPQDFLLEHILTVVSIVALCLMFRRFRLSNLSYTLIFVFLFIHVIGAHYTYSEVPYDSWSTTIASWFGVHGFSLNEFLGFSRNHYDRLVHFCFGFLLAYPAREVFVRIARARGFWSYYLPIDIVMAFSMIYELLEWGIALIFAGDVGQSYLGTQGDVWDAHKDMALATLGAFLAMLLTAAVNWRLQRSFVAEFTRSLKATHSAPLGEVKIQEMLAERKAEHAL